MGAPAVAWRAEDDCDAEVSASSGRRFFDAAAGQWIAKVFPGEYYVTGRADEVITTILGSCVAACIRDPLLGIGGMNHFMLPHDAKGAWGGDFQSTRYGNFAMEKLLNELIKAGCRRDRLEVKVFGGGNVTTSKVEVGTDNADFVMRYLRDEGLACAAQDLKGPFPRRVHYTPSTGKVVRRFLGAVHHYSVSREEADYAGRLTSDSRGGDIELFG